MKATIHYAGELVYESRGATVHVQAGWAACARGAAAERIAERGNHTWDDEEVSCSRCLRIMDQAGVGGRSHAVRVSTLDRR